MSCLPSQEDAEDEKETFITIDANREMRLFLTRAFHHLLDVDDVIKI